MGQMLDIRPDLLVDDLLGDGLTISLGEVFPTMMVLVGAIALPLIYKFKAFSIL